MITELQSLLDNITAATGFAISVGYRDVRGLSFGLGSGPSIPSDFVPSGAPAPAAVTARDTMLLGSGTKPYTAAAVMRLVDEGKVRLSDRAADHIDGPLRKMKGNVRNLGLVELLGPKATNMTIGDVIRMRSGVADFDIPSFDHELLIDEPSKVHSPWEALSLVADFPAPDNCPESPGAIFNCTFVCDPGTCTSYSSTNFILAGLVLLAHAPEGQDTWENFDQLSALGLSKADYPDTHFLLQGAMNSPQAQPDGGLTVAGSSLQYGRVELLAQDSSILGWTCGNAAASAQDVARFYYELLHDTAAGGAGGGGGRGYSGEEEQNKRADGGGGGRGGGGGVVSKASLASMEEWTTLDVGWARGYIEYGAGLMIQNVDPYYQKLPPHDHVATYFGHGGDTYAFLSDNGWFPALGAAMSVIVNQDHDFEYPSGVVTCPVVGVVAKHLGVPIPNGTLHCAQPNPDPKYACVDLYGTKTCVTVTWHHGSTTGTTKAACEASCH